MKDVTFNMINMPLQLLQNRSILRIIDNKMAIFDMCFALLDKPGHGIPRTTAPMSGDSLKPTFFADILNSEGRKISFRPHVNSIKFSLAG